MSVRSDFYVIVGYDLTGCETEKYEDWEYTDEGEKYHCNQSKDKIQFFNDPMSGNYLYFGYILGNGEAYEFETTKFDVDDISEAKAKVQDELMKFETFMEWALSNGYKDNLELDRIDNDKNYEPNNCQWITHKENNNKRGNNRIIELNGQAKTLSEWAEIYNISSNTIWSRLERGWETERAITTLPKNVGRRCWKTRQGCKSKEGGIDE